VAIFVSRESLDTAEFCISPVAFHHLGDLFGGVATPSRRRLYGHGLGFIDAHLLAAALLTPDARLWTRDRRLRDAAERVGVGAG
jgi:hypothetical protein